MIILKDLLKFLISKSLLLLFCTAAVGGVTVLFSFYSISSSSTEQKQLDIEKFNCLSIEKMLKKQELKIQLLEYQRDRINRLFDSASWLKKNMELQLARQLREIIKNQHHQAVEKYHAVQKALQASRSNFYSRLLEWFTDKGAECLLFVFSALFILPLLWSFFMYFIIARAVEKLPPLKIRDLPENSRRISFYKSETALTFPLNGKELYLRRGDWGKKRIGTAARTRLMWKWSYPVISLAADLCELIAFTPLAEYAAVTISAPCPDLFITRIDLNNSNGVVIKPKFLVGITADVQVKTCWNFNFHNILSGRLRQIILYGSGSIFIVGSWGVEAAEPKGDKEYRIEDELLIAYAAESCYSMCRTETFWHYWRNQTSLFDQCLKDGIFFTQNNNSSDLTGPRKSFLEKFIGVFLSSIGKLLGF